MSNASNSAGVILAGGLSRRMGGEAKAFVNLQNVSLLGHVVSRFSPQIQKLVINANGSSEEFDHFGLPVIPDTVTGFKGPLAGILAGMEWANKMGQGVEFVVSVACDTPFLPLDLVERLKFACEREGADIACAVSNGRHHPVIGLWPVTLAKDLQHALEVEEIFKIDRFTSCYKMAKVEFGSTNYDPFFNINSPQDLTEAEKIFQTLG